MTAPPSSIPDTSAWWSMNSALKDQSAYERLDMTAEGRRAQIRARKRFFKIIVSSVILFCVSLLLAPDPVPTMNRIQEVVLNGRHVTSIHMLGWQHSQQRDGSFHYDYYSGIALVFTGRRPHLMMGMTVTTSGFVSYQTLR